MTEGPNQAALDAVKSEGEKPASVGAKAEIAPLTAAGVDLARRTMWMIAAAVVLLILLLSLSECSGEREAENADKQFAGLIVAVAPQRPDSQLQALAETFRRAADDPSVSAPANAAAFIDRLVKGGIATDAQTTALNACRTMPAPDATDRAAVLQACAAAVDAIGATDAPTAQRVQFMGELQKQLSAERTAYRAFWLQVAQLVLINLLLPILTALLGYIFGTQQSQMGR